MKELRYLTIEEAAGTLRVSERTIRRWVARGHVQARKVGGTVRIPRDGLTGSALQRPAPGRPRKGARPSMAALSDEACGRTWDNRDDAVYDRWQEIYGLRQG